ncbi:MAG: hypothetical protein H6739_37950 [Alphaproteobacteria bacterium]|nr:hypothetical protein [Alphaproteobacteria bacterium]
MTETTPAIPDLEDLLDPAVHLLDLSDELATAIEDTYRRAVDLRDARLAGKPVDLRALLIAYGGLCALMAQAQQQLQRMGEAIEATPLTVPGADR